MFNNNISGTFKPTTKRGVNRKYGLTKNKRKVSQRQNRAGFQTNGLCKGWLGFYTVPEGKIKGRWGRMECVEGEVM